jgi:UDP-glucose 4-epimerase
MGVRRFVFISSIGVHGVHTNDRPPFRHDDRPSPVEDYAISKLEAEHALHEIAEQSGLELVILRPTLVYGPGVGANFLRLLRLVDRGFPLPFGAIRSRRSLVSIDNLAHLIILCTRAPAAVGQTFLVADGEDISLPDLIRKLANGLGRSARLVGVPRGVLLELARFAGKAGPLERLASSLEVDIDHTRRTLAWRAPVTLDDGLEATARWYRQQGKHV